MASPVVLPVEDKDLEDADLWAVIDSAAASYSSSITTTTRTAASSTKSRKPLALKTSNYQSPPQILHTFSPPPSKAPRYHYHSSPQNAVGGGGGEVRNNFDPHHYRPQMISRSSYCVSEVTDASPLPVVRHGQVIRSPATPIYSSPESGKEISPFSGKLMPADSVRGEVMETARQIGFGGFVPTVSLFKEYQDTAMAILDKSDYVAISGTPYIKKSGWRKMAFYFNVSFEIKDKKIEVDENRNVQRAEFVVRAHMQSGRFSDGWGSCDRRDKRFMNPNHDVPSTAETRAKNKACQDLLGIGQYRPGASRNNTPR